MYMCFWRFTTSCSTSGTRCVTLIQKRSEVNLDCMTHVRHLSYCHKTWMRHGNHSHHATFLMSATAVLSNKSPFFFVYCKFYIVFKMQSFWELSENDKGFGIPYQIPDTPLPIQMLGRTRISSCLIQQSQHKGHGIIRGLTIESKSSYFHLYYIFSPNNINHITKEALRVWLSCHLMISILN